MGATGFLNRGPLSLSIIQSSGKSCSLFMSPVWFGDSLSEEGSFYLTATIRQWLTSGRLKLANAVVLCLCFVKFPFYPQSMSFHQM